MKKTMLIKVIWALICMNATALVGCIIVFSISAQDRNVDAIEKGWMGVLVLVAIIVILLAAIRLRLSQSSFSVSFAGFFAVLPVVILLCILAFKYFPSFKEEETASSIYYKNKTQRAIAAAIENNDTLLLKQLIKGRI